MEFPIADWPELPPPPALLSVILDLLMATEEEIEHYARLRRSRANVLTSENPDTVEGFKWIRTSVQDIAATLEAISRDPPPGQPRTPAGPRHHL